MTKTVLDFHEVHQYVKGLKDLRRELARLSSFSITSEVMLDGCYSFTLSNGTLGTFFVHYISPLDIQIKQEWTGEQFIIGIDGLKDYITAIQIVSYNMLDPFI